MVFASPSSSPFYFVEKQSSASSMAKEKKMLVGVIWNCAADLKLLLAALLLLCSLATLLQFLPAPIHFYSCFSQTQVLNSKSQPVDSSPPPPTAERDQVLENGVLKRAFNPYGAAAYSFITMGAYRGGLNTFAIVGLASKPLHLFGNPTYQCEWVSHSTASNSASVTAAGRKILPDWGYGRVYTVVVVNCTFDEDLNAENSGGKLLLHASTSGGGDENLNLTDRIEALTELPGNLDPTLFSSTPKYDYLYCGSPLYGNLSPQRVREWIAYHVRLFGERSHFVIYDAGGVHEEVLEVLKPWMELGYVTLQDVREQERFDGYYHNQFLVVNDCLHRYKFMAKWIFFFDLDEFLYLPPTNTIKTVLDSLSDYTQFTIKQMPMSNKLCLSEDAGNSYRKWGIEKLVYRDVKRGVRRDRKYAVQPRNVYATGVHLSQNFAGKSTQATETRIRYFHYHGTIAERREPCRSLVNTTELTLDKVPYLMDTAMRDVAAAVKRFELRMIGSRLHNTPQ